MATPKTVATYDLNGSLREFDFAFDYLARSFVQVTLIGAARQVLTEGTGYSFVSATRIRTSEAFGPPQWTQIEIRRVTSATERLVDFQDASILRADDLNLSDLQVLHIAEEAREAATETIGTNSEGMLDARGRRIVNLADPINPGDAVSRLFYDTDKNGALVARTEAVAARNGALTSQQAAAASQTASRASEVAAKASQDAAKASQDAAAASQVASKSSENAAKASQTAAAVSQVAAKVSEDAAKVSEDAAKVSQTAASGSESRARASEVNAKSSETNAAASQVSATASMNAAESYKTAAAASQAAAKVSEDAASASKDSAQASSILSMKWAVNPENVEISTGQYSSMHWALKAQAWAQAAESGVLPAGGVKWSMLDPDIQTNRFLPLSGGTLSGGLSVTGDLTAAGVSSTSMTVGGKAVATAESVTGVTTRVSTLESTTASLGTRATNLESRASSLESSTSGLNTRVGSLEAVRPVKYVNWAGPDANGNVNVATAAPGVPLDCYGAVGEIALLYYTGSTSIFPGVTVSGSLRRTGVPLTGTGTPVAGTWRNLGSPVNNGSASLFQRIA